MSQNQSLQATLGIMIGEGGHRVVAIIGNYHEDTDSFDGWEMRADNIIAHGITSTPTPGFGTASPTVSLPIFHTGNNGFREWDQSKSKEIQNGSLFIVGGSSQKTIDAFIAYLTARDSGQLTVEVPVTAETTETATGTNEPAGAPAPVVEEAPVQTGHLPDGFPGKAALEAAGITTFHQLHKFMKNHDLVEIPNIGDVTAAAITEAVPPVA